MNTSTKLIDQYLSDEMTPGERYAFEERLETDRELSVELEQQRSILQGIEFSGIRMEMRQGLKSGALKTKTRRLVVGISAVTLMLSLVVGIAIKFNGEDQEKKNPAETKIIYSKLPAKNSSPESSGLMDAKGNIKATETKEKQVGLTEGNNIKTETKLMVAPSEKTNAQQTAANVVSPGKTERIMIFGGKRSPDGQIKWMGHGSVSTLSTNDSSQLSLYSKRFLDSLKNSGTGFKNLQISDSVYKSFLDSGATKILESDTTKK